MKTGCCSRAASQQHAGGSGNGGVGRDSDRDRTDLVSAGDAAGDAATSRKSESREGRQVMWSCRQQKKIS